MTLIPESKSCYQNAASVQEALEFAARSYPDQGITIWDRRCRTSERRSYPQLLESIQWSAARWRELGLTPGQRVLVCLPNSWAWLEAWFGALWAGGLPVAIAPGGNTNLLLEKLKGIQERIGASHLICDTALKNELEAEINSPLKTITHAHETFAKVQPAQAITNERLLPEHPDEIAFLQLTSGSTGLPRAVMISHRAALHNPSAIADALIQPMDKPFKEFAKGVISWLPLNHDMGLIGCLLFSLVHGLDLTLLRPDSFLLKPKNWLARFSEGGPALAPAPNFAYQTCVQRISKEEARTLKLGNWCAAMTGAEMIQPETYRAFSELFSDSDFKPETFRPCFGLAEGTLAVTFDRQGKGIRTRTRPQGAQSGWGDNEVVSTGPAVLDSEVKITAPDSAQLPEGTIGQVRAQGPGLFSGYYNDPEASQLALQEGWLCTGDQGFLYQGELYLTGRSKDVLIIHGHNIMPHEIEWLAEGVAGGGGTERCAAFSITHGTEGEQAVLVMETLLRESDKLTAMAHEIKVKTGRALGLPLADICFVRRGQIPKTTSGKVQRRQVRDKYLAGSMERIQS